MRFDHWSWGYARARARVIWHQRSHPDEPWLTADAVRNIAARIHPRHTVLEWGAGRSTVWFARRARQVVSIEHDPAWHESVCERLEREQCANVDLRLVPVKDIQYIDPPGLSPGLDWVLVDGRRRGECALHAVHLVAPGGWLIVDDAERYLPISLRPRDLPRTPPDLRGRTDGMCLPEWVETAECLQDWNLVWTSDGVKDTVLWQRPEALDMPMDENIPA